jgi:tetratricopeptide (TPR) repeat protein
MDHDHRWKAIRNYYTAWRINETSRELHPGYDPGLKTQGILELIAGAVPGDYSWVLRWAGIKGSIESGRSRLREYYWKCSGARQPEAVLILTLAYLQFDVDHQAAFEFIDSALQGIEQGLLHRYLHALAAMKAGENDQAIDILASLADEAGSKRFYYVYLLLGEAKLNRLDQDAGRWLELFLQKQTGKNYIKMACHKLSWFYFLNDDREEYLEMKARVLSSGQALVEADRQAELEAGDTAALHPVLLVARLCFDGGYYERGIQMLLNSPLSLFASVKAQTERDYRLARLYQRSGNLQEAVMYYRRVLTGAGDPMWVFYPNSMLQLGIICEETGQYQEAAGWYRSCLALKKEQYRRGIDLEAESGLSRIEAYLEE